MEPDAGGGLKLAVVLGSIRKGRRSERPARLVAERAAAAGYQARLVDLKRLALPMYDEEDESLGHPGVAEFRAAMAWADATAWLVSEYNHGYPAALKNAVDYLRPEIRRKPALVCGVSRGVLGGPRGVEQFKLVLVELHAVPIRDSVYFPNPDAMFDAGGNLVQPDVATRIDEALAELAWYAKALRWGREHLELPARRR